MPSSDEKEKKKKNQFLPFPKVLQHEHIFEVDIIMQTEHLFHHLQKSYAMNSIKIYQEIKSKALFLLMTQISNNCQRILFLAVLTQLHMNGIFSFFN